MADKVVSECAEEEDFASMFAEYESEKEEDNQYITEGRIVGINDEYAMIDVGQKSEGRIHINEIKDADGNLLFNVGSSLPIIISGYYADEQPIVSHQKALKYARLQQYIASLGEDYADRIIEGVVTRKNKNNSGFIVESDGVEFFLPTRSAAFPKDRPNNIGKRVKVCIVSVKPEENSIIVSRRRYYELENTLKKEIADEMLRDGKVFSGVVKRITSFGMFVEVPFESATQGRSVVEGLVHYTEISHKGPVNPSKLYKEGDTVSVKAIKYDPDKKRLSLSIKAVSDDPWKQIQNELEVGDAIKVIVSNVETYGAFVDLGNDIEGFLHISEISWDKNIQNPSDYIANGQEIDVEVIEINTDKRRLRVSLKKLLTRPFEQFLKTHKEGDKLTGVVATLTDFGAFIKIGSVDGLLHNEDAFWRKEQSCRDALKIGQEIEVKISKIDREKERISLTRKGLIPSPTEAFAKRHKIDDIIEGKIRDIKDFGVFIHLEDGVDALIRTEDLPPLKKEELHVGDKIKAALCLIDAQNNRVRASVRRLEKQKEKEHLKQFNSSNNNDRMTLGDMIKK